MTSLRSSAMLVLLGLLASACLAQVNRDTPELEGVGITEKLDQQVPLDLTFTDENGQTVRLADYFHPGRPVILTLNYYSCPMLCTVQLNGLVEGLKQVDWVPGQQFEIVTVSFNPNEIPTLARLKKQNYIKEYGKPEAAAGWHFLTGKPENIARLTEAVGFHYKWDDRQEQYIHAAAAIICTPDGRISRYLKTVVYDPQTLKLAVIAAKEGQYRSTADQILLFCYHYDPNAGTYTLAATNIVRAGGVLTVVILGSVLLAAWLRDARRKRQTPKEQRLHE